HTPCKAELAASASINATPDCALNTLRSDVSYSVATIFSLSFHSTATLPNRFLIISRRASSDTLG
ncbi:hypothetical protein, partial [Staphylococcus succinus]|uniref:hypothetical protein n=1 Tax=Staphylococcus succinus TaxID=61015 RepID=UPI001C724A47